MVPTLRVSLAVLLCVLAPGCAGAWTAERSLRPASGQSGVPGPRDVRGELLVVVERDRSVVRLSRRGGATQGFTLVARLECKAQEIPIGWGPFFVPAVPAWLIGVPLALLRDGGPVRAAVFVMSEGEWTPTLALDPDDVVLERGDLVVKADSVKVSPGHVGATFDVDDPIGRWTLRIRRLRVDGQELVDLGPVRFEPDLALTFAVIP